MKVFRVVYRPETQLSDRVVEADDVSWPDEDWGMIGFYSGVRGETFVAAVRNDLVAAITVDPS